MGAFLWSQRSRNIEERVGPRPDRENIATDLRRKLKRRYAEHRLTHGIATGDVGAVTGLGEHALHRGVAVVGSVAVRPGIPEKDGVVIVLYGTPPSRQVE